MLMTNSHIWVMGCVTKMDLGDILIIMGYVKKMDVREEAMFKLEECLRFRFTPKEFFSQSSLGDLVQAPSDIRESQYEPTVELERPRKLRSSVRVVGVFQSRMTWILVGSTCTPYSSIMYPRY